MSTVTMKELPNVDYKEKYRATEKFITDFNYVVGCMREEKTYMAECDELEKMLRDDEYVLTVARLTEIVNKLSYMPYKFVNVLLANITRCRDIYFAKIQ